MDPFSNLSRLLDEWKSLQPLKPEDEKRLWRKLKLEWNYHSNHIEGNTLTYGETELLLIHGQTSGDHALRDYIEMQAHDLAIEHLRAMVSDSERSLTEADVRDLNRILLKESFWKDAITTDGLPTRIEIRPGEYKTQPNNVRTASGEIFHFAEPVDVSARMSAMLERLQKFEDGESLHPVEVAAWLHHEFVLIHPFGDGNGRVARLLVNFVLMRAGYLPLIVPTETKDSYLASLRIADAGDLGPLTGFLAECLLAAMHRGIRAAKGDSIEEEGDLEKEIEIFKRRHSGAPKTGIVRSGDVVKKLYLDHLHFLLVEFVRSTSSLDGLFSKKELRFNGRRVPTNIQEASDFLLKVPADLSASPILLDIEWSGGEFAEDFEPGGVEGASIEIAFQEFSYFVHVSELDQRRLAYDDYLTESECRALCRECVSKIFARIKERAHEGD